MTFYFTVHVLVCPFVRERSFRRTFKDIFTDIMLASIQPLNPENIVNKRLNKVLKEHGLKWVPVTLPPTDSPPATTDDESDGSVNSEDECKYCKYYTKVVHVKGTAKRKGYDRHYAAPCDKSKRKRRKSSSRKK